jgi:hypothetical protein
VTLEVGKAKVVIGVKMAVHLDNTQLFLVSLQHGGDTGEKNQSQLGHFSFSHSKGSDISPSGS